MPYTGSQAQSGRGTTISIGTSTPPIIGEVSDIQLNRGKWDFANTTNLESGSDEEMLAVIRKAAQMSLKGNRVDSDAGQVAVEAAYQAGSLQTFVIQLPKTAAQTTNGDKYTFTGYVAAFQFTVAPTKQVEFSMEIQTSGPITLTVGS